MGLHLKFKDILWAGSMATATLLTGCGGSGSDSSDAPEILTFAPTVEIQGSNRSLERETIALQAVADDIDGTISAYEWSVDLDGMSFTGGQGPEITFTAPDVDEDTVITFKVTVTDNDNETATDFFSFTSAALTQELFIAGTAIDEEIINAEIFINVGDQNFETTANSTGGYYLTIDVNERNFKELVKITAFGQPDIQPGVKLISLLTTFEKLVAKANSQNQLGLFEDFNVNVTNLSTAKYFLAQQLAIELAQGDDVNAEGALVTAENYDVIYAYFDPAHADAANTLPKLIERAIVIKAIVDIDGYELPSGVEDTYELLSNETSYIDVLARINSDTTEIDGLTLIDYIRVQTLGNELISEFPDFDGDGIFDIDDDDRDNDGIQDADSTQVPYDYSPFNAEIWGPRIEQITFVSDDPENDPYLYFLAVCIQQSIRSFPPSTIDDVDSWTQVNAHDITILRCPGYPNLKENGPLAHFVNLESLTIQDTGITDISSIAGLTKLVEVDVSNTNISSVEPFAELTNLEKLDLSRTTIADISPLSNLTLVKDLNLANTNVADITALSQFSGLELLDLSDSAVTDLTPLEGKQVLTTLLAHDAKITTLANFSTLPALQTLTLYGNGNDEGTGLSDISNLAVFANFTELDLSNNNIEDISVLADFTKLTNLDLSYNNITDISALTNASQLVELNLSDSNVAVIDALADKPQLSNLVLSGNNITSLLPLATSTEMTVLLLENNNITSLDGLANLLNLQSLQLENNDISDVTIIIAWPNLPAELDLTGNFLSKEDHLVIAAKAETEETVYFGDWDDREIITGGPFTDVTIDFQFDLPQLGTNHRDSSSYQTIEELDRIHCVESAQLAAPICYESRQLITGQTLCSADAGSQQMTCTEADEWDGIRNKTWYGTTFSIDFDQSIQPNNKFIAGFENRLILTLLRVNYAQVLVTCSALDATTNMATCELTENLWSAEEELYPNGMRFSTDVAITWQQDHTQPFFPRCDGVQDTNTAQCYPVHGTLQEGDRDGKGQTNYDATPFTLDMSKITLHSIPGGCEEGTICRQ
ncbi:leucine-rich repeat domain-containing protein [Thalassotalea psychrophila]|uniref:Leucine-rich repeat domain-containing protein n=1 Tax=Thalassotalea psychrophila TaxID=3065647 RepID=A0ABY9TZ13_9GAMM|nr:leucine-rich repeat domain-containing protein [Colwelliaceae bacterium SQ149]